MYVPEVDFPTFPVLGEYIKVNGKIATEEDFFRELLIFRETYKNAVEKYCEKLKLKGEKNECSSSSK